MIQTLRVALAQINPTVGDLPGNTELIIDYIHQARRAAADLIVFPELTITGYPPEDLVLLPSFVADNLKCLQKIAAQIQDLAAVVGFVNRADSLFNGAAVLADGKIAGIYHKICLPNYGVFDEKRYFVSGKEILVAEIRGVRVAINICEDIWEGAGVSEFAAAHGAQVIANLSASPYNMGKAAERENLVRSLAIGTQAFVLYVNCVGGQDELLFDGQTMIVDADGKRLLGGEQFVEKLLVSDIQVDTARPRPSKGSWSYGLKHIKIALPILENRPTLPASARTSLIDELQEVFSALALGTRDYVRKNGFDKVVLGLSGGIDSALTAVIAARALGAENVVGVLMPSRFTSPMSVDDALAQAKNLGIKTMMLPIDDIVAAFEKALNPVFENRPRDFTEENLQARVRGMLLMAISNKFNWLLLTTGNKSEYATGYCTLYGDMAGAFAVLKDVPKTMVYRLSKFVNQSEEVIPANTIQRPPTAELRLNQHDQDTLPPYDLLDRMIAAHVESNRGLEKMIGEGIPQDVASEFLRMVDRSEFKRRQAPPGVKITTRAFGRDRRMPITHGYKKL